MTQALSFRASIGLIVGAYAALLAVLVFSLGQDLWVPVGDHAPQVSWLLPETTDIRTAALEAAGRPGEAALYALSVALSWSLLGALGAGGFAWGVMNKGDTVLGVDKALSYLAALSAMYAIATGLEALVHHSGLQVPRGGLHTLPGLWFAAMIPSAAILARMAALAAHDVGSLLAIAIAREPARLAALVATVEAKRGAKSLEAKLARRMARPRG